MSGPCCGRSAAAFPTATVRTTPGCTVSGDDRDGFDDAVRLAAESDIAVMVMGDKAGLTVDSTCGESRDRASLDLPGVQEELLRAVLATGTPVVLVLVAGRPCGSVEAHERCAAVVAAWLPGDEGAAAIADVLSGAVNPGGKLPVSFPRTAGHIPVYYRQKRSGGRSHWKGDYVDAAVSPLYPFGHGLSYTSFELTASIPTPTTIGHDGEVTVAVTVTNTGSRDGDEVVQLYTRDPQASLTRPVLELKAFARVSVPVGEHRTVTFTVHAGQLGFYDRQLEVRRRAGRHRGARRDVCRRAPPRGDVHDRHEQRHRRSRQGLRRPGRDLRLTRRTSESVGSQMCDDR